MVLISEFGGAWRMVVVNKLRPGPKQKESTEHITSRHPHKYEFEVLELIISLLGYLRVTLLRLFLLRSPYLPAPIPTALHSQVGYLTLQHAKTYQNA